MINKVNDICRMNKRHIGNKNIILLNDSELIHEARKGITRSKVMDILELTELTILEMCQYIHVSPRTLQRKDYKEYLPSEISEKVLLIQNLYARGSKTFGSLESFSDWMNTPNITMEGQKPKDLLDTYSGIEYLKHELGRLEHGLIA